MGRFLYKFVHVSVYLVSTDNVSLAVESERKKKLLNYTERCTTPVDVHSRRQDQLCV